MKRLVQTLVPAVALAFLNPQSANASHAMGGDLTYECIGNDSFLVTLKFFRSCLGINAPSQVQVNATAPGCFGSSISVTLMQVPSLSGIDITPLCPGQTSRCSDPNSVFPFGVEQYVYQAVIVLPADCPNWTLSWTECCRNAAITTLVGGSGFNMFIAVQLNNTLAVCDSSPIFFNEPVPFTCIWQPTVYNHGVLDPEGDSLWFSLVECLDASGSPVTYQPGYSALQPLHTSTGVVIDNRTGTIFFTPDEVQVGVLCVKVEEFRNGVKIGEVTRDIQFSVVDNCLNEFPVASGIDGSTNYDTAVCPGNLVEFTILTTDTNPFHSITMSWNAGIPGGTFTMTPGQHPSAVFSWLPTSSDLGTHFFTVTVKDDACPVIGTNVFAYVVEVRNPDVNAGPDLIACEGDSVTPIVVPSVDFTSWEWLPNTGMDNNTIQTPTFSPSVTTTYTVHAMNAICEGWDTITISIGYPPTLSVSDDAAVCFNQSTTITASGTAVSYSWAPVNSLVNSTSASPTATPTQTTMYTVTATSADGCDAVDSVLVTVNPLPDINAGQDVTMCEGQETILTASGGVSYVWEPAADIVGSNTTASVTAAPAASVGFTVTGTDANGCEGTDTVEVIIQPAPTADAGADITIWLGQTTQLFGNHSPTAVSWIWSPDLYLVPPSLAIDDIITVEPQVTTTYYFTVTDLYGCTAYDSVTVTVDPEGDFYMPNAFSPNGDQWNEEFYVVHLGPVNLEYFRIYNRWGRVIFEGNLEGEGNGWDGTFKGKDQPVGVYTYVVKSVSLVDGTERVASGSVTLMR